MMTTDSVVTRMPFFILKPKSKCQTDLASEKRKEAVLDTHTGCLLLYLRVQLEFAWVLSRGLLQTSRAKAAYSSGS